MMGRAEDNNKERKYGRPRQGDGKVSGRSEVNGG